ncbi:AAA family ATPase [Embleya sp. NPDC008237]|uniref:helix-turn-helix transcriptional regulator n=1 Tax=Embleya sp. NPDC008237 TaxID=3363978 RepID=UPI0036EDE811
MTSHVSGGTAGGAFEDADAECRASEARLPGRDRELARITASVGREPGAPRVFRVLGEEGIGRTGLLRAVCARARRDGALVLLARGRPGEETKPFDCLRHLLDPVGDEILGLPAAHRQVLTRLLRPEVAGHAEPADEVPAPPAVQAAVAALFDHLADADRRVVVAVDDVQDCDRLSLDLIEALAGRHIGGHPTFVLTAPADRAPMPWASDVETVHLAPLSARSAAELLDAQPNAPSGRARLELLERAQGNPAAVLELCRLAATRTEPWLAGRRPSRPQVGHAFEARLRDLPPKTRQALLYAALSPPDQDLAAIVAALGSRTAEDAPDPGIWAPAENAGLIAVVGGRVEFRHPLGRLAAETGQPVGARQRAHRDLAAAPGTGPMSQARHRAAGRLGPDEAVAQSLAQAAGREHGAFLAARAFEQAAALTPGDRDRAGRLAAALTGAAAVGDPDWVRDLWRQFRPFARPDADPEAICLAACAMGAVLSLTSRQKEAFDLLVGVAETVADAAGLITVAVTASGIAAQSGLPQHLDELPALPARARAASPGGDGSAASAREDAAPVDPGVRAALEAAVAAAADPAEAAVRMLRRLPRPRLGPAPYDLPEAVRRTAIASVAYHADEPDVCVEQYRSVDADLRAWGAFGLRAWSLAPLLDTLLATGRWAEAAALIAEADDDAAVLRLSRVQADLRAFAATLGALRGDADRVVAAFSRPDVAFDLDENRATSVRLLGARAADASARGDWNEAFRRLRALFGPDGTPVHRFLSVRGIADLAVAAHRTGCAAEVLPVLTRVRTAQGERPTGRMTQLLHHASALVDPQTDAEQHFRLALVNPEGERWPVERARTRLSYAAWLRRARRPSDAREQLCAVLDTAEVLGAAPLADAARTELRASGVATAREGVDALAELTAQQRQIVTMAASGLSNREIGERLMLSPRTIGAHLYHAYPKLGVSSRHQLRDLLTSG